MAFDRPPILRAVPSAAHHQPTPGAGKAVRASRRQPVRPLAWLLVAATLAAYHTLHGTKLFDTAADQGAGPEDGMPAAAVPLRLLGSVLRARQALQLERQLDGEVRLGLCHDGAPLVPGMPARTCEELHCLWSEALGQNVDLWARALEPLPAHAAGPCPPPAGGQRAPLAGTQPLVSFIVTMHNGVQLTMQAVLELYRTAHEVPSAEFVLVDDGSSEDTAPLHRMLHLLRTYFGARAVYARNEQAVGFGAANVQGVELASGQYVALINNDVFVARGWLTAIMWTFQQRPRAGIVGPLFVGADGLIAEAGGLVWQDGSAANVGRGWHVSHEYNYLRPVDYVSAACIVLPRNLFFEAGGFDPQYDTAYYEDTDLAMTVSSLGFEVLMQPLAVVYHQEGSTLGTDATSDLKRSLMAANRERFHDKWAARLQEYHCPPEVSQLEASRRLTSPRVLWIDNIVPEPDRDAGSVRNINIMQMLLEEGYGLSFQPTAQRDPAYETAVREIGVHVLPLLPPKDWQLEDRGHCMYDVAFVARRPVFEVALGVLKDQCPGLPIIFDTVDLHFLREAREALTWLAGSGLAWDFDHITPRKVVEWLESDAPEAVDIRKYRDLELKLIDAANLTLVVSPDEVDIIRRYRPKAPVGLLPNIHRVDSGPQTPCQGRSGLLFVGNMNHVPNQQAVVHLVLELLPMILAALPEAERPDFTVHVVGANQAPEWELAVMETAKDHVVFHGYLSDEQLRSLYSRVRLAVAPLLSGAGVKGKVNQAMNYGVPVIATPLAVEGMHATDGIDCMVGATPQEFVRKCLAAYSDCGLWARLAEGGRRNLRQHFGYEEAKPRLLQAYASLGQGPLQPQGRATCRAHSGRAAGA